MNNISNKKKITVISSYYEPDVTACTYLFVDLAKDFYKYGADVSVVCGIPNRLVKPDITKYYEAHPVEKIDELFTVYRVGPSGSEGKNFIYRVFYHLYRSYAVYKKAKDLDTDIYIICSAPPFMGIAGAFLSKKAPTVYNLQDVFPDSLITAKNLREESLLVRLFRKVEKWIYEKNTHVITISEDIKESLKDRNVPMKKVSVVYNWIDVQSCVPIDRNKNILFEKFALARDKFYVSYAGNIGLLQNVATIIKAAEIIEKTHPDIKFVIIGDGAWKIEMDRTLAEKKLKNVVVFPMQPVGDISHIYSLGDIEIVTLKAHMSKSALPSKTWSIMAAARPIICEIDLYSKLCDVIYDNNCGECVAPGDYQAMSQAIIKLYNQKESLPAMGENGRRYVEENLSREFSTKQYFNKLMEIANSSKKG